MSLVAVQNGTRVEIRRNEKDSMPYLTTVGSVLEEGRVLLDVIRIGGEELRLPEATQFVVRFFTEGGVYIYPSLMRGYMVKGEYEFMVFQTHGDGERVQRRQAYRLRCGQDTDFKLFDRLGSVLSIESGSIRDISSGGVRLYAMNELEINSHLYVQLPMIGGGLWSHGTVLSKDRLQDAKYNWQYGVEFMGMSDNYTESITQYVLLEQQKARARK
ncbi:MAG: PilZ domain-containing protein [Defluviitaleaceae bacterium]|nr:PilZ domain-containing protein [Defluviitaleaceae bacterium]